MLKASKLSIQQFLRESYVLISENDSNSFQNEQHEWTWLKQNSEKVRHCSGEGSELEQNDFFESEKKIKNK